MTDVQVSLAAGLLTVGLGLSTLYFTNPSWGTPVDYLAAILWGSVVGEGLKYVGSLVDRVLPSA